jgi:hypothetical protein
MTLLTDTLKRFVARLWHTNAPLTGAALLMLAALPASLLGVVLDPRVITGAPAWLKPAKFAVSTTIYMLTLAWIFTFLPGWPKTRRVAGWTTAVILVLEVVIIDLQAWRGVTSHFNVSTPLNMALWATMGLSIAAQTLVSITVMVALWRQRFQDPALGWALRLGLLITIVGASTGGLMTRPTEAQLKQASVTHRMLVAGAHTVGAPDGGPGLPATGWSFKHGDLRVAHFFGLHAMQALPLLALTLRRTRRPDRVRVRLMLAAAASYFLLFVILLQQALRGLPLIHPDALTVAALGAWAALTAAAAAIAAGRQQTVDARQGSLAV